MSLVLKVELSKGKIVGPIDIDIPLQTSGIELSPDSGDGFYLDNHKVTNEGQCQTAWNNKMAELGVKP